MQVTLQELTLKIGSKRKYLWRYRIFLGKIPLMNYTDLENFEKKYLFVQAWQICSSPKIMLSLK